MYYKGSSVGPMHGDDAEYLGISSGSHNGHLIGAKNECRCPLTRTEIIGSGHVGINFPD